RSGPRLFARGMVTRRWRQLFDRVRLLCLVVNLESHGRHRTPRALVSPFNERDSVGPSPCGSRRLSRHADKSLSACAIKSSTLGPLANTRTSVRLVAQHDSNGSDVAVGMRAWRRST